MSYKIPDNMQKVLKDNLITYVIPEPKIETEPQSDGSIKLAVGWDTRDFTEAVSAVVRQMNEAFDDAIIEEFAASNGYVKKPTCVNESESGFLCSMCKFGDFNGFHGYEPNFCPNCDAKVRKKNND